MFFAEPKTWSSILTHEIRVDGFTYLSATGAKQTDFETDPCSSAKPIVSQDRLGTKRNIIKTLQQTAFNA